MTNTRTYRHKDCGGLRRPEPDGGVEVAGGFLIVRTRDSAERDGTQRRFLDFLDAALHERRKG
jgi:hypothetical protein